MTSSVHLLSHGKAFVSAADNAFDVRVSSERPF